MKFDAKRFPYVPTDTPHVYRSVDAPTQGEVVNRITDITPWIKYASTRSLKKALVGLIDKAVFPNHRPLSAAEREEYLREDRCAACGR